MTRTIPLHVLQICNFSYNIWNREKCVSLLKKKKREKKEIRVVL